MIMKKIHVLMLALASTSIFTSAVNASIPGKLIIFEGGGSYSHTFYKSSVTTAESHTPATPNGFAINPSSFFPQDFYGGYLGVSLYMSDWLLNTRYDMYGSENKSHTTPRTTTTVSIAPTRLAFTVDKVWGCINQFSYGVGGGAVIEDINKGEANTTAGAFNPSESIQGRSRIDPLIEGFAMYRLADNIGVKLNLAYQIPVNNKLSQGDFNLNLGVNYALPI
jgi:hypothetical protein